MKEGEGEATSLVPSSSFFFSLARSLARSLSGFSFPAFPTQSRHHYTTRSRLLSKEGIRLSRFPLFGFELKRWAQIQNNFPGIVTKPYLCSETHLQHIIGHSFGRYRYRTKLRTSMYVVVPKNGLAIKSSAPTALNNILD